MVIENAKQIRMILVIISIQKYDDQVDRYYSTYDIGTLLHNNESYLGTIDSKYDVDYYSFLIKKFLL